MKNQIDIQALQQFLIRVDDLSLVTITPADINQLRDLLDRCWPASSTLPQLTATQKLQLEQTISDLVVKQREYLGNLDSFGREDQLMTRMLADISSELARLTNMINTNRITGPLTSMFN
jgi:hypothetical protein